MKATLALIAFVKALAFSVATYEGRLQRRLESWWERCMVILKFWIHAIYKQLRFLLVWRLVVPVVDLIYTVFVLFNMSWASFLSFLPSEKGLLSLVREGISLRYSCSTLPLASVLRRVWLLDLRQLSFAWRTDIKVCLLNSKSLKLHDWRDLWRSYDERVLGDDSHRLVSILVKT